MAAMAFPGKWSTANRMDSSLMLVVFATLKIGPGEFSETSSDIAVNNTMFGVVQTD